MHQPKQSSSIRMIAIDMDGTLLGEDGKVSPRNLTALLTAEAVGIEIVVATGRRHCYAMRVLRALGLHHANTVISSNGTVTRTLGSFGANPTPSELIARTHLPHATALWLCGHVDEFRNALVLTFDRVGPEGEDSRGALVVEHLDELNASIGRWMEANEPYIAHVTPIEDALNPTGSDLNDPIQAMLCGTIERMARAEARLLEHPGVHGSGQPSGRSGANSGSGAPSSVQPGAPSSARTGAASSAQPGAPSSARFYRDRVGCLPPANQASGSPASSEGLDSSDFQAQPILTLHRTEYPNRDLSILDILPAGCSKGAAILSLAAVRGIDASEILAIGDNWNDVSMLEIAGGAVLMENAPDDLKALALTNGWRIGLANHKDGVAEAIEAALAATCEPA